MSGLCPFATKKLIPAGDNDPAIDPRVAILHVDAGNAESLFDYFSNRSGGIESHFFIKVNGDIEQYRNIYRQADANLDANDFAVSIETQGYGSGTWTVKQLESIKILLRWLNKETEGKIPLRKIETWNGSGIGYHTLFGAPSHWTPVAKTCPGPERIKQFNALLVPWMKSRVKPVTNAVQKGRALLRQGLKVLSTANPNRKAVKREAAEIRESLNAMPKK